MKKLNITFVVHSLNPGGAERLALDMCLELKNYYNISVICLDEPGMWTQKLRREDICVTCFYREEGIDVKLPFFISNYTRKFNTDIIHAHQTTPWFYSALSRILNPKPYLLFEEHGRFYPEVYNKKKILFNKFIINRLTHAVVAVSEDIKKRLIKYEGISEKKIQVIYNGIKTVDIDVKIKRQEARKILAIDISDFVVGSVGRLDKIKNYPMLIKAVKESKKDIPNLKCIIIGDGPEFGSLKELIRDNNLEKTVKLTGYREDASSLVCGFDVFVLPSFSEGISMAILEAMRVGVPCIATRVGGNIELIQHNITGWLVESDNLKELAKLFIMISRDKNILEKVSINCKKSVVDKFSFNKMMEEYISLYNRLTK